MKNEDHTGFESWLHGQTRNLPEPEVPTEFLTAQRRSIYRRRDRPRRNVWVLRWALSFAMLLMVVAGGITWERQHNAPSAISPTVSDDQLFSDLAAMEQTNEPKAIAPIHGLFQE
ncbi:MAG TPA: hypothetical protein VFW44_02580 [Bryobacteraceae bacterium]|nr:hypothetical protein [Bryobacteraceae bacterium]